MDTASNPFRSLKLPSWRTDKGPWLLLGGFGVSYVGPSLFGNWFGGIGLMVWMIGLLMIVRSCALFGGSSSERLLIGGLGVFGCGLIGLDGGYLVSGVFTKWWVGIVLGILTIMALWLSRKPCASPTDRVYTDQRWTASAVSFCASAGLLALFISGRTEEGLVSPWNLFGLEPFLLCLFSVGGAIGSARERDDSVPVFVWIFCLFALLSVSAIVYGVGFGFDPFVHRAAETALANTGSIEPVRLLYSGQYVLVTAMHWITSWSIKEIDIWLVPMLASVFIPLTSMIGFERGWQVSRSQARSLWIVIGVIPFMLATFTVPFTITYVFFLGGMVAYPYFIRLSGLSWVCVLLGYGSLLLVHPLLAGPFFLFLCIGYAWIRLRKRTHRIMAWIAGMSALAFSVPMMIAIDQNQPLSLLHLWEHRSAFFSLFRSPYWDPFPFIPWYFQWLYALRYWLPMVLTITVGIGLLIGKEWRKHAPLFFLFSFGLLGSIWGASTLFFFPGIIAHEQGEFSLRLLQALYTFSLPVFAFFCMKVTRKQWRFVIGMVVTALVTMAWFFSYPQYNLKYPFFSPSVGREDKELVRAIETASKGSDYVVLSHQMTSAAALQEFGFAKHYQLNGEPVLWYAIPTGGPLYALYTDTLARGAKREAYEQLGKQLGVQHVYFIADAQWVYAAWLITSLEEASDHSWKIGESTVYEFIFPQTND